MEIKGQLLCLCLKKATDPDVLKKLIAATAESGMNFLFLYVNEAVRYRSHPEVSAPWAMAPEDLRRVVDYARERSLEVVPVLSLLSHATFMLNAHPEFSEGHSSRYCPQAPGIYPFVFDLMEELAGIFNSKYFHIGHDEILSDYNPYNRKSVFACQRCRAQAAPKLFAEEVCKLHSFLAAKNIRTFMWADAFLDPTEFRDASFAQSGCYGGAPDHFERAINAIPRDIIMCDWHYEPAREYPTIRYLQEKGFETLGCPWHEVNSYLFTRYAVENRMSRFKGMMATAWFPVDRQNYIQQKRQIERHGFFFANPGKVPRHDPVLTKVAKNYNRKNEPCGAGKFRKVYRFDVGAAGTFQSLGWSDLRYLEWPGAYGKYSGRFHGNPYPHGMELKAGRRGSIEYELNARAGHVFEKVILRPWFKCPGSNAIQVRLRNAAGYHSVAENKTFAGSRVDISALVKGADSFRLKFVAGGSAKNKTEILKGFEVGGVTVRTRG